MILSGSQICFFQIVWVTSFVGGCVVEGMSSANKNLISKVHSGMWGDLQTSLEEFGRSRYVTTGDSVRFVIVSSNFSPIRNASLFRRRFANVVVLSCSNSHITVMLNNLTQRPKELFTEVFKYVPVSSW